jgi:hypothetical protein
VVLALVVVLAPGAARGEHEVYYRYIVLGYVKAARGQPVAARSVELVRDKTGFSYIGETDARGFFVIIARLGDESVGEPLTLRVGGRSTRLTARFDATNHTDHRGTRVDLEGARFVERRGWFRSTLAAYLARPGG